MQQWRRQQQQQQWPFLSQRALRAATRQRASAPKQPGSSDAAGRLAGYRLPGRVCRWRGPKAAAKTTCMGALRAAMRQRARASRQLCNEQTALLRRIQVARQSLQVASAVALAAAKRTKGKMGAAAKLRRPLEQAGVRCILQCSCLAGWLVDQICQPTSGACA